MIDIAGHIHELFYHHDCVILPGFGGFILHSSQGRYDTNTRQFTPPSRGVSFNGLLTGDDGLLIASLVEKEGLDYERGRELIRKYVGALYQDAETGPGATIEGIGKFVLSDEGKWVFYPSGDVNFLESAFGLEPVVATPIPATKARTHQRPIKTRVDRHPAPPKTPVPTAVKWTLSLGLPVIIFLLWGILFPGSFQRQYASYSGFLSEFLPVESLQPTRPASSMENSSPAHSGRRILPEAGINIMAILDVTLVETTPVIPKSLSPRKVTLVSTVIPSGTYHVIGGVFMNEKNANRYVATLSELGYNAALVGINNQGHYRVCYDSFATWKQAVSFLERIKRNENPSAWILKY